MSKYRVVVVYGGIRTEYEYRTEKRAMKHYAGWYNHALDMYGQISNRIEIWCGDKCILADIM